MPDPGAALGRTAKTRCRRGEGEAIIAGIAVTAETRAKYAFSRPYLQFPGALHHAEGQGAHRADLSTRLQGERVGVIAGSAHERMLRDYFPDVKVVTFAKQEWLLRRPQGRQDRRRLRRRHAASPSGWPARTPPAAAASPAGRIWRRNISAPAWPSPSRRTTPELAAAFDYALHQISIEGHLRRTLPALFPGQLLLTGGSPSTQVSVRWRALVAALDRRDGQRIDARDGCADELQHAHLLHAHFEIDASPPRRPRHRRCRAAVSGRRARDIGRTPVQPVLLLQQLLAILRDARSAVQSSKSSKIGQVCGPHRRSAPARHRSCRGRTAEVTTIR